MRYPVFGICCILASLFLSVVVASAEVPAQEQPVAVLRALDKDTARVEQLDVPVNEPLKFGTLLITVHTCRVSLPEEPPEAAAFIEVSEFKPGDRDIPVFQGWMFASSPALSAMQHPIYDIWVIGCKTPSSK